MGVHSIPALFKATAERYPTRTALGFVNEREFTYLEVKQIVAGLSAHLKKLGIRQGDRVAILSHNMPQWGMAYLAITSAGAVAVPMMPDFKAHEIELILQHSGASLVFSSTQLAHHVPAGYPVIVLESIEDLVHAEFPEGEPAPDLSGTDILQDTDLASIIYTSGTTGEPKGVMLSHGNILFAVEGGAKIQPMEADDRFLSVLPLSHIYEFTLGLILPIAVGASVKYLRKPPTAQILMPAMQSVRPTVMLTVPLLIEKVYWKSVYPTLQAKPLLRLLYRSRTGKRLLHRLAGKKVYKSFGGSLKFYGIGGSKLDGRVETFLRDGRFPYAIGYGLTETSPLLAGGSPYHFAWQSTGSAMAGVELRIHNADSDTGIGEIQARGKNVMQGYFRNPELTREVFSEDGWFRTGDLGYIDGKGQLHIKGRLKTTIIGANGKNIFPEDIEHIINSRSFVKESLVVEKSGKLTGLVHLDYEAIEENLRQLYDDASEIIREKVQEILRDIQEQVNQHVNKYSKLQVVVEQTQPFERTPSQKIKRFLYQ
ncbi:MAG TPA: AMP-binding protein [Bacteroidales bacterium]|nr:AMP-binding protein [Bacteroidales bacterium]HRZ49898.1 AMP-binding protein [Bacteroidales bacterium]